MNDLSKLSKEAENARLPGRFRPAVIKDSKDIHALVNYYVGKGFMLPRALSEIYETIRQYCIYEEDGKTLGVCGLHVTWEDLGEVRALAVDPDSAGRGIGSALVKIALEEASRLGLPKVFTLTYVPDFFARLGFTIVDKQDFPHKIWGECIRCHKFPDCDETGMIIKVDEGLSVKNRSPA
ncbi:Acetyltransferase, GNAT family [hydrothermal vent metagenome]|uniref:Acetyltransferase, GNAT family n=1 Tax=hydrothermal vent metagenome TaxID=652676 RepID=A0A3B1C1A2_9ZZZZ